MPIPEPITAAWVSAPLEPEGVICPTHHGDWSGELWSLEGKAGFIHKRDAGELVETVGDGEGSGVLTMVLKSCREEGSLGTVESSCLFHW